MSHRRLFLAAFEPSGTVSLHGVLARHPETRVGDETHWSGAGWRTREPHFFDEEWDRGLDWYDGLFQAGGSVRLDSTPNTVSFRKGLAVRRIRSLFPDARFLALIRDPVARAYRAWSDWRNLPAAERPGLIADPQSFGRSVRMQLEASDADEDLRPFVAGGYFLRHFRRFTEIFPRDQLLPVFASELEAEFDVSMKKVAAFAGLEGFDWERPPSDSLDEVWLPDRGTANLLRELYEPHDEALATWLGESLPWRENRRPQVAAVDRVFKLRAAPVPPARQRIRIVLAALHSRMDNELHIRAVAAMARSLEERGHEPVILVGRLRDEYPADLVDEHLAGLECDFLEPWPVVMDKGAPLWTIQSVAILNRLREEQWDSIVLPAAEGTGHATLEWLQQGHHRHPCRASVYLIGRAPSVVQRSRIGGFQEHPTLMQRDWLERRCLELADDVLLPDSESRESCMQLGWALPRRTWLGMPGIVRRKVRLSASSGKPWLCIAVNDDLAEARYREIAQSGRHWLSTLAGVRLVGGGKAFRKWLERMKTAPVGGDFRVLTEGWPAAGSSVLLLSPSSVHPWMVQDLLDAGLIPLSPEEEEHPAVIEWEGERPPQPGGSAREWLESIPRIAADRGDRQAIVEASEGWLDWCGSFDEGATPGRVTVEGLGTDLPLVSVCMATHNRTRELEQTLSAFRAQDWPRFEVVLVNDGSTDPSTLALHRRLREEFAREGWIWIDQANAGPAVARNRAAAHARGDYVLFADDDNVPMRHHITALMTTLLVGGHDVALAHMVKFSTAEPPDSIEGGEMWWMPVGGDMSFGIFCNGYGETSMLMTRETFLRSGGFLPDSSSRRAHEEDRVLLNQVHLQGLSVAQCPQPTYWYRVAPGARHTQYHGQEWSCQAAAVDVYCREVHQDLRGLFEFAANLWDHRRNDLISRQQPEIDPKWERKLSRSENELRKWKRLAYQLAINARRLMNSRRWRTANFTRLHRPIEFTFPTLSKLIQKAEDMDARSSNSDRK